MGIRIVTVAAALFVVFAGSRVEAQTCSPGTVTAVLGHVEVRLDDTAPFSVFPIEFTGYDCHPLIVGHQNALKAVLADVDHGYRSDVVIGGNGGAFQLRVYYLQGTWPVVTHTECLPDEFDFSTTPPIKIGGSACYDVELGDLNGDDFLDLVVGRKLDQSQVTAGSRDTVFLHDGLAAQPGQPLTDHYPQALGLPIVNPTTIDMAGPDTDQGSTFAVELGHIDSATGALDLLAAGSDYGLRCYTGNGNGTFTYRTEYVDGPVGQNRDVQFGDVDGDGDDDLILSRISETVLSGSGTTRSSIWFSGLANPGFSVTNPYTKSNQAPLQFVNDAATWTVSNPSGTCVGGTSPVSGRNFESAFGDLDNDGDLDLVCPNSLGKHLAFRNDGNGVFGCSNSPGGPGVGAPAFIFPSVTSSWTGRSTFMELYIAEMFVAAGGSNPFIGGCRYDITVPGSWLNYTTGVELADVNLDGSLDVTFSSRNDLEELAAEHSFPYLSSGGPVVPPTFDHLFLNNCSDEDELDFDAVVELLGDPNDGTGYGEWVDANEDGLLDWLDANFDNLLQNNQNNLWWGVLPSNPVEFCQMIPLTGPPVSARFGTDIAGLTFQVIASAAGTGPGFEYLGAIVPLEMDAVAQASLTSWQGQAAGWLGLIDGSGIARTRLQIGDLGGLDAGTLSVVVCAVDAGRVVAVSPVTTVQLPPAGG
jgi:FG-GAP-like repeat